MLRRLVMLLLAVLVSSAPAAAAEKYVAAADCYWPPMELLDAGKQPAGYSPDYLKALARAVGIEIEVRNVAWDGIFGGVATGQYDIVSSSVTITEERKKQFDFTDPYYEVVQAVVLPAGKRITALQDLKGLKVGGQIATTGIFVLRNAKVGAELKEYDDVGLAIQDMVQGRLDAVICDDPVAMYYVNKKADTAGKIDISFKTTEKEYYGFVVKKGRKDLLDKLNKGIRMLKESGEADRIAEKWLGRSK